jgi:hypothetical protein
MLELKEATGIDGELAAICAKNPQILVFKCRQRLHREAREQIFATLRQIVAGTSLEGVKVLVLDQDMDLQIIDDVSESAQ